MILYPAIDIRGGRAVRLLRGDYDRETRLRRRPGRRRPALGRRRARASSTSSTSTARATGARSTSTTCAGSPTAVDVPVQVGGGLRDADGVRAPRSTPAPSAWCSGPARSSDPALVEALVAEHGERVVVSVDARGGAVAIAGWEQHTEVEPADLLGVARRAAACARFVYTPVDVDGTLQGPGLADLRGVAARRPMPS